MFTGFSQRQGFNGVPNNSFGMNGFAYGLAGVSLWLDAEFGTNTSVDLAAISNWTPIVGQSIFSQATAANQPRFNSANPSYNNHSTIEFFDTARFLSTLIPFSFAETSTLVFVANYDTIADSNTLLGSSSSSDNIGLGGSAGSYNGPYFLAGQTIVSGTTDNTNPKIVIMQNSSITNNSTINVNGVVEFTGTKNYPIPINQIGKRQSLTSTVLRGKVAEIILFDRRLTTSEQNKLTITLQSKYGL